MHRPFPFLATWLAGWHRWCRAPVTPTYAVLTLGLGLLAAGLVLPPNGLATSVQYLLMLVLLGWLARLAGPPTLRRLWQLTAGLLLLGLSLELFT